MSKVLEAFLRHEASLKKYLYRFFSRPQDVEDVAQEAFLKVFATEIRTQVRQPKALLFRAAKHAALTELSKKANTDFDYMGEMDDGAVFKNKGGCDSEEILDARRKLAALSIAIAGLPPVCRQVFIMRKIEALPMKEVAARLNISVSTAEKHGAEGLVKCSRRMRELGYDPQEFGVAITRTRKEFAERTSTREEDATLNGEQTKHY